MKNPTDLMQRILTDTTAQRIIDYVSPIYGQSEVALWIYEAIGKALSGAVEIAEALKGEGVASASTLLLKAWERYYRIPTDPSQTVSQRQQKIAAKIRLRGPLNPHVLAGAISAALGGVPVEITEHIGPHTFLVNIREVVPSIQPAVAVLERRKPAHLIYEIQVATETVAESDIKIAIAQTHAEYYRVEVQQ
ncbi:MAG: DUF2313 domain-containing protein [Peptococcaceae bacterium]|nr:DUF2313 domain-containing protein [Peptococcaceae bacterium]